MRLLFISDATSIHTQRWAQAMVALGHEVVVLSVRPACIEGVAIIYQDPGDFSRYRLIRWLTHLRFILLEIRLLLFGRFDVVQVHYLRADLIGWVATCHPRSVVTVWGSDVQLPEEGGDPRRVGLRRRTLERTTLVTVTNRYMERLIKQWTTRTRRIEVVCFGIDPDQFTFRPKLAIADDLRICLVKPRILPMYASDIAIHALDRIMKVRPGATLTITGKDLDPEFFMRLKGIVAELNLGDWVFFPGRLEHEEIISLLSESHVFIQPSRWESFGVAILEAWAIGLPVVSSRVAGAADLIRDGETGLLVPPEDVDSLVEAILRIAEDGELRERIRRNAREEVCRDYRFGDNLDRMESLLYEVAGRKRG